MKYVKQIVLGDDEDAGLEQAADEAMAPQYIVDQLKQLDPDDLNDVVNGLVTFQRGTTLD